MGCRRRAWVWLLTVSLLLLAAEPGWAEREHFQLKLGATYDQGDFGTPDTTRTLFVPLTLRYLGERFDLGVTGSFVVVNTEGGVVLVDGTPTRTEGEFNPLATTAGVGDTVIKGRLYLVDDPGSESPLPSLTPFAKVKIPTADEERNLGTGETDWSLGLEVDKRFGAFYLFGDAGYTFIGSPPGQDLRDRPAASLGAGVSLSEAVSMSALVAWRRALVAGTDDPVEAVGSLSFRLSPRTTFSPHVFVGLTDGAPDFGAGFEVSYRFGRW